MSALSRLRDRALARLAALEAPLAEPSGVTADGDAPVPPVVTADPVTTTSPVPPAAVTVDGDLEALLDAFPDAKVTEPRLAGPSDRVDLQRAFPDAGVLPLGDETPADAALEPWTWSLPLPPRRTRPREPRPGPARLSGPDPTACRFCGEPCDVRETGGDPDGGFSHLECWAAAGHPDVGYAAALAKAGVTAAGGAEPCKRCGLRVDWKRDGVAFGDGTCAHLACHGRAG